MKALLIDDSVTARKLLGRIFNDLGNWEIVEAANGQQALEIFSSTDDIDLACIDWNMPVMNGLEFVKEAKKLNKNPNAWLMMVTTETEMDNVTRAMVSGANEYVMKPFDRDIIVSKLQMMGLLNA